MFVIGDAASVATADGRRVPGVAPAAKQQGRYVAQVIAARIAGRPPPPPFAYRDAGNLATIGRKCAVIEFPFITLRGFVAWWLWGIAHIYFLVGVPSPVLDLVSLAVGVPDLRPRRAADHRPRARRLAGWRALTLGNAR